jgi:carbonic anhydrase/acetyltransferase-like protein (isoleucine patch superfamily)
MTIYALGDIVPDIHPDAYVHPDAVVIGNVSIGSGSTVWPCAVLRGDYGAITVGERTSIQDGCVIHATKDAPTRIGSGCVIGHNVHLEGCTIHDHVLVGSGAIAMHEVVVESRAVVAAGAVLLDRTHVPSLAMALGVPATVRLDVVTQDFTTDAEHLYVRNGLRYKAEMRVVG